MNCREGGTSQGLTCKLIDCVGPSHLIVVHSSSGSLHEKSEKLSITLAAKYIVWHIQSSGSRGMYTGSNIERIEPLLRCKVSYRREGGGKRREGRKEWGRREGKRYQ